MEMFYYALTCGRGSYSTLSPLILYKVFGEMVVDTEPEIGDCSVGMQIYFLSFSCEAKEEEEASM